MAFLLSGGSCSVASPSHHHRRSTDRRSLGRHSQHPLVSDASSSVLYSRKPTFQHHRGTPLMVSLQESVSAVMSPQELPLDPPSETQELQNEAGLAQGTFKNSVWVNPKSPRAARLRQQQQSSSSRYARLAKVAQVLSSVTSPTDEDIANTLAAWGIKSLSEQDTVVVLNSMETSSSALASLRWFLRNAEEVNRCVILYNVTLKVMKNCRDWEGTESLLSEMLLKGVKPDNITFSTVINCARLCNLWDKAVEWSERMPEFECKPDDITYSAMIDAYGRSGKVDMALSLYDRSRAEGRKIDAVTFSTVIGVYSRSGDFDGALKTFKEMKALGVEPNVVTYNMMLEAMGRADRPWQVKTIYKEMVSRGISPNVTTYAKLLRAYGRARYPADAFKVYKEMKEKGMELNVVLYNILLTMCADMGLVDEASEIFESMRRSPNECKPDSWTFSALMTIYSCSGQVSEAESILYQMKEAGMEPNIFILTSLIQCYGKAKQTDSVVKTFDRVIELGIVPDDRFCGCLLNVLTQTPEDDLAKVLGCIDTANPKLGQLVRHLLDEEIDNDFFRSEAEQLFTAVSKEVKGPYCNCLIDVCINLDLLERACILLDVALKLEIYSSLQSKTAEQWSLHVKKLSLGAALTALHVWINDLSKTLKGGGELPPLLGIHTGHGKHKYTDRGLAVVFESHLRELNAPFHESTDKAGWFLTTKVAAESWLESRATSEMADSKC